jgi:hypothetical protein
MKGNYQLPKFRKGNKVKTPDGEGHIVQIRYEGGTNWHEVKNKFYSEYEITKL